MSQNSACPSHALITAVSILTVGLSLHLLYPDLSGASSLTERTSDNQRLGTCNFTTFVAKQSTLKSQLDWATDYSLASFRVNKLRYNYASAVKQLRDVNVALIAIRPMPFDTTAFANNI